MRVHKLQADAIGGVQLRALPGIEELRMEVANTAVDLFVELGARSATDVIGLETGVLVIQWSALKFQEAAGRLE